MGQSFQLGLSFKFMQVTAIKKTFAEVHEQYLLHATLLKAAFPLSEKFQ